MTEFIGFSNIIDGFSARIKSNKLSHAHLIIGPDGIGKSLIARKFAMNILEKTNDIEYADIINFRPKKASLGVDEVREIIDEVNKKPFEGDKKVIIIHKGSKMTIQAQNALLKTIEEPPKGVYIIILSESLELMLDTIKSRSQIYKLTPLNKDEMRKYLDKLKIVDEKQIKLALSYGEGIPGRAEEILYNKDLSDLRNIVVDLLCEVSKGNSLNILEFEDKFNKFKNEKDNIIRILVSFIRDIIVNKEMDNKERIINIDKYEEVNELSKEMSYRKLNGMINDINETRNYFNNNVSFLAGISMMLIKFLED